ncbi:MAG: DsbA family protein [Legionellaceae bacterium]|nr:DsbA family protein [Legionellaceae bacterium]
MKRINLQATVIASALLCAGVTHAVTDAAMAAPQKKQVEQVVHDYLVNHPEVLLEASQALQKKQQDEMQHVAKSAILKNADQIFKPDGAFTGNPKGNVTIVEFFDYQCVHCKRMKPIIGELSTKNPKLRVIYKELPIFGKRSETASRAALAAAKQGKYAEMQAALLKIEKRLDDALVMSTAQSVGLDMAKLKQDMQSQAITDELAMNQALAEKLNLMGTPAFILASTPNGKFDAEHEPTFIPGAATLESLQDLVSQAGKS